MPFCSWLLMSERNARLASSAFMWVSGKATANEQPVCLRQLAIIQCIKKQQFSSGLLERLEIIRVIIGKSTVPSDGDFYIRLGGCVGLNWCGWQNSFDGNLQQLVYVHAVRNRIVKTRQPSIQLLNFARRRSVPNVVHLLRCSHRDQLRPEQEYPYNAQPPPAICPRASVRQPYSI